MPLGALKSPNRRRKKGKLRLETPLFTTKGVTITIEGAIRNELDRGDLHRLGHLTKCDGIMLLGETQFSDDFSYIARIWILLREMALQKRLRINHNAHYRRGSSEYNV